MSDVHLFISTGRFKSFRDMRKFIDPTYTDDGDEVPSTFMREVGLWQFEPGCIEAIYKQVPTELVDLLAGVSYVDQWLSQVDGGYTANAAICVFPPNQLRNPKRCSLEYVGSFKFQTAQKSKE